MLELKKAHDICLISIQALYVPIMLSVYIGEELKSAQRYTGKKSARVCWHLQTMLSEKGISISSNVYITVNICCMLSSIVPSLFEFSSFNWKIYDKHGKC